MFQYLNIIIIRFKFTYAFLLWTLEVAVATGSDLPSLAELDPNNKALRYTSNAINGARMNFTKSTMPPELVVDLNWRSCTRRMINLLTPSIYTAFFQMILYMITMIILKLSVRLSEDCGVDGWVFGSLNPCSNHLQTCYIECEERICQLCVILE